MTGFPSFKKKSLRGAVKDPEMTCAGFFFCVSYWNRKYRWDSLLYFFSG